MWGKPLDLSSEEGVGRLDVEERGPALWPLSKPMDALSLSLNRDCTQPSIWRLANQFFSGCNWRRLAHYSHPAAFCSAFRMIIVAQIFFSTQIGRVCRCSMETFFKKRKDLNQRGRTKGGT